METEIPNLHSISLRINMLSVQRTRLRILYIYQKRGNDGYFRKIPHIQRNKIRKPNQRQEHSKTKHYFRHDNSGKVR